MSETAMTGWRDWVYTTNHKKIGILYTWTAFVFFFLGGIAALLMRAELATPGKTIMDAQTYYQLFSIHGSTMIFLFVIPIFSGLGNYLIPLMIGAPDMAFPRLNALSYWLYLAAGILLWTGPILGFLPGQTLTHTIAAVGWTGYPPLSAIGSPGIGVNLWIAGIQLFGISGMMGGINFVVTILRMRRPGITFNNMSLYVWAQLVTSVLTVFATPMIGNAMVLNFLDRTLGAQFFTVGGDPLLYQHLFWFYSHPAVYIMILPAFGIISEVLPKMVKRPIFGYHAMAYSIAAIAFLGFTVWAHHMFVTGIDTRIRAGFMLTTMIIAVPTGVKIFNWIATMWGGKIEWELPFLWAVAFIAMFVIGGIDGVYLAAIPVDYMLNNSYWVVAHIHYVLFGGSVLGLMAGMYYWFPRFTGKMLNRKLGLWHFWLTLVGLNLVFMTMHLLGTGGMPRRVYDYRNIYSTLNLVATIGAFILGLGQIPFIWNVFATLRSGETVETDPWNDVPAIEWEDYTPASSPAPEPAVATQSAGGPAGK